MTRSLSVQDREIALRGRLFTTASNKDEWYKDIVDLRAFVDALRIQTNVDLLNFLERPAPSPVKQDAYWEWEPIAALRISSYKEWYEKQINRKARYAIRRAKQEGVEVKSVPFDDELVAGICNIYNESAIRQGKPFWHYKKPFEEVKKENSTYLEQAEFIGAFHDGQLVGFIKLIYMETYADPMQIISMIAHRDKYVTNALLGKAVELCEQRSLTRLYYGRWEDGSGLSDFKKHNGFERVDIRRYYVPVSFAGRLALKMKLHRGMRETLPPQLVGLLKTLRAKMHGAPGSAD